MGHWGTPKHSASGDTRPLRRLALSRCPPHLRFVSPHPNRPDTGGSAAHASDCWLRFGMSEHPSMPFPARHAGRPGTSRGAASRWATSALVTGAALALGLHPVQAKDMVLYALQTKRGPPSTATRSAPPPTPCASATSRPASPCGTPQATAGSPCGALRCGFPPTPCASTTRNCVW